MAIGLAGAGGVAMVVTLMEEEGVLTAVVGVTEGVGVGETEGVGVGVTEGVGVGATEGVGVTEAVGVGVVG